MSSGAHLSQELVQRFADLEIADVDARTIAHAESCSVCSERIADAALGTLRVHDVVVTAGEELAAREAAREANVAHADAPSPAVPLLVAVLVAALASLPLASDWATRTAHLRL